MSGDLRLSNRSSRSYVIVGGLVTCLTLTAACNKQSGTTTAGTSADTAGQTQIADAAQSSPVTPASGSSEAASQKRKHVAERHTAAANTAAQNQNQTAAQTTAAPAAAPPPPPPPLVAASGTALDVIASDTITTSNVHVGDPVSGTVASDVRDASGNVVIPAGSTVQGSVTVSSGPAHSPKLAVAFTSLNVGGHSYALQSSVTKIPLVNHRRTARVAQVGEVGGGAAAGALIGRLIGGSKTGGTAIGAVVGAAGGAVVADKTQSNDAVLPKGAHVSLQLTTALTIPRS